MLVSKLYRLYRRAILPWNRFRANYKIRWNKRRFRVVIPAYHSKKVRYFKYTTTTVGLLSSLYIFDSVWNSFAFACFVFLVSYGIEKTIYSHPALFIHALPDFQLEPDKWLGIGFGYTGPPSGEFVAPVVSMIVNDAEYARKLHSLFLSWSGGEFDDKDKNISVSVVVLNTNEYIFFCHPNFNRPLAKKFFNKSRKELRKKSLEDELAEQHIALTLGKRCLVGPTSYFPQFRRRYRSNVPVLFDFLLIDNDKPRTIDELRPFVIFDFSIKERSSLTKNDIEYGLINSYRFGGKWQGPKELAPKKKWWEF